VLAGTILFILEGVIGSINAKLKDSNKVSQLTT
jgi:hypothetical protein